MKRKVISRRANFSVKERLGASSAEADKTKSTGNLDDSLVTLRELTLSIRRMLGMQQVTD